ncbi:cytochrome c-type biogenesis protein CcmH [Enterobacter sp. 186315]
MIKALMLALLLCATSTMASEEVRVFASSEQEQTWRELTAGLRCPKCQNNSIADSDAMIAADMRQKVWTLLQEGKSRDEIVEYMVARYGQFVTYDPPFTPATSLLWLLPALALLTGGAVIYRRSRRRVAPMRPVEQPASTEKPLSPWLLVPGVALAAGLGLFCYLHTGSYTQVRAWQTAVNATPDLLLRLKNPQATPLSGEEVSQLTLGLRTRLAQGEQSAQRWMLLARLASLADDGETALYAWRQGYRLDPENREALLGYVKGLTQSSRPEDKQRGGELLRARIQAGEADPRLMMLYAVNALEQGRRDEAVKACEALLRALAQNDPRRAMVENLLSEARR